MLARVCKLAMVYNGDGVRGTKEDPETFYFVPREGGEIWLDDDLYYRSGEFVVEGG